MTKRATTPKLRPVSSAPRIGVLPALAVTATLLLLLAAALRSAVTQPDAVLRMNANAGLYGAGAISVDVLRSLPLVLAFAALLLFALVALSVLDRSRRASRAADAERHDVIEAHRSSQRPEQRRLIRRQRPLTHTNVFESNNEVLR